jgi:hypothetical protein
MIRIKNFTETMDEQAQAAYVLCLELLEKLYAGGKVSQAKLIDAVGQAWKIHNRFAAVYRHNERLKYTRSGWDRSQHLIWGADPAHIHRAIGDYINVDRDIFSSDDFSLISFARELLMEAVDYPTRKIVEQWKALEATNKETQSILDELKYIRKEYTEPPLWGHDEDIPKPEVDTYLAGIEFGIKMTKNTLEKIDPFGRWTKKSAHEDVRATRNDLTRRYDSITEYIEAVLEKYNGYPIQGLARLHGVTVRAARQWCEKGLIEARQINEAWLIDKAVAESFVVPRP